MAVLNLFLGRPLASDQARGEQIGSWVGIPVFGLDAWSSAAYGPEAALTALIPLGAAASPTGMVKAVGSGGHPSPVTPLPRLPLFAVAPGLWLLLQAFASGCAAMTAVEAVSNGANAFLQPVVPTARRTRTMIIVILSVLLAGIAYMIHAYGI